MAFARPALNKTASLLIEVCDTVAGNIWREIAAKLSELQVAGPHRRFLVQRLGSTGSTWLAKLLNSHRDVFCYHEGVISKIFPARSYGNEEILGFIQLLSEDHMHDGYAAVGDVGSTWLPHVLALPREKFSSGVLLRHPAKMLNTRLKVFPSDQSFTPAQELAQKCIDLIWGIRAADFSLLDQIFLQDAFFFASQVRAIGNVDVIIQIERMRESDYGQSVLRTLTGQTYDHTILQSAVARPVNSRRGSPQSVPEILDGFNANQRRWYEQTLGDLIGFLGYSLESDEPLGEAESPYVGSPD
jgi:hypothetical protein